MDLTRMDQTLTYPTHPDKVFGPSDTWNVPANDWRDGDEILILDGCEVYARDENSVRADVDWSKGWWLQRGDQQVGFESAGEPPAIFKQAFLEGRVLFGAIIARDLQRHN